MEPCPAHGYGPKCLQEKHVESFESYSYTWPLEVIVFLGYSSRHPRPNREQGEHEPYQRRLHRLLRRISALGVVALEDSKIDEKGQPQKASLSPDRCLLREHDHEGVGSAATLLLPTCPHLPYLWGVGIPVFSTDHVAGLRVVEVIGNVPKSLPGAGVASDAGTTAAGLRMHDVPPRNRECKGLIYGLAATGQKFEAEEHFLVVLLVFELGNVEANVAVVPRLRPATQDSRLQRLVGTGISGVFVASVNKGHGAGLLGIFKDHGFFFRSWGCGELPLTIGIRLGPRTVTAERLKRRSVWKMRRHHRQAATAWAVVVPVPKKFNLRATLREQSPSSKPSKSTAPKSKPHTLITAIGTVT